MNRNIVIYTKDDCSYCSRVKKLLTNANWDFKEIKVGRDISREDVKELFPTMKTLPIVVMNDDLLGGYAESKEYYDKITQKD